MGNTMAGTITHHVAGRAITIETGYRRKNAGARGVVIRFALRRNIPARSNSNVLISCGLFVVGGHRGSIAFQEATQ